MSKYSKESNQRGIVHIQSTQNNTLLTLTNVQGDTLFWTSAGNLGFRNARKSTPFAAQMAAELLATKALNLGFSSLIVKVKGLGYGKQSCIRALYKSRLSIIKIVETTPIAHNGCRAPKKRRV